MEIFFGHYTAKYPNQQPEINELMGKLE